MASLAPLLNLPVLFPLGFGPQIWQIALEFKVIFNLKIAKELGITIPTSVLARADEVIE